MASLSNNSVEQPDPQQRRGLTAALAAYGIWGLSPLYFSLLKPTPAAEILAHRVVWSVVLLGLVVAVRGQTSALTAALTNPRVVGRLALGAVLISFNWYVYLYAIETGRVLQASLGYFINPLTTLAAGVLLFGERLGLTQTIAVVLAGVACLIPLVGATDPPWIAFALAASFTVYSVVRKALVIDPAVGLLVETLLVLPVALLFLATQPLSVTVGLSLPTLLLIGAGAVTAVPLMLFAIAARRLPLSTLGLLAYSSPSIQLLIAVVQGEPFGIVQMATFGLVWLALALFSVGKKPAR
ncbi:MAG: EamA family transporter RarD [Alphaproteobacteria bacterium]|nr:EamA family transporter RarD [Alphaproteobacteria bacterium]